MSSDLKKLGDETLPDHLSQLRESSTTMEKIAAHCRNAQKKSDYDTIYQQTFDYSRETLTNFAYHVHTVGTQLTRFIILQSEELEKLSLQIKSITDTLDGLKSSVGLSGFVTKDSKVKLSKGVKQHQFQGKELPESSRQVARYIRRPITEETLSKIIYQPHKVELVPPPFESPMDEEGFITWRSQYEEELRSSSSSTTPTIKKKKTTSVSKKDKKDKKDKKPKKTTSISQPPPPPQVTNLPPPPPPNTTPAPPPPTSNPAPPPPTSKPAPPPPTSAPAPPPPTSNPAPPPPPLGTAPPPPLGTAPPPPLGTAPPPPLGTAPPPPLGTAPPPPL